MRNPFFLMVLLPGLVLPVELSKSYYFAAPLVQDGKIIMNNCHIAATEFAPCVAVHGVQLLIPMGNTVTSYNVEYSDPILVNGTHYIRPAVPPTPKSHGPFPLLYNTSAVYSKDAFFPSGPQRSVSYTVQYKNGIPIFCTTLFPSQYNPVSQQIRYFDKITITIRTAPVADAPAYYCTPAIKSSLKALVQNPEQVNDLPLSQANHEDYEYMIVCKTSFANSFGEFVAFNTRRGMRTKIFTVDDVKAFTGSDVQDKLRNLIKQEYTNHHIRYVLIASNNRRNDAACVPHRGFYCKFYDHDVKPDNIQEDNNIPADMYYACLDGDWKTDKNGAVRNYGFYGTEDIGHELYVGRFCVNTTAQLTNMINKTIKYSEQPVTSNAINNVMLAGEFLWDDFGVVCTGTKSLNNLKGTSNANNFTTYGFPTNTWTFIEVSHEKNPNWQEASWSMRDQLFYSGISQQKCSWVNHNGHASTEFAVGTVSSSSSAFYRSGANPVLADNKTWQNCNGTTANYFFFTSGGCYNGAFDNFCPPGSGLPYTYSSEDCWAACATRLGVGPVAMISNSRYGMGDNDGTDGGSDRPMRWIHDAMFNPAKKIPYAGHMLANAKESDAKRITLSDVPNQDITQDNPYWGAIKYCNYELNLFGDPALSLWTAAPVKLSLQPSITNNTFILDTKGPYSWVALLDDQNSIFLTQQTGIDGICTINDPILAQYLATNPTGVIKVKVKAHNYLPDSAVITISTGIVRNRGAVRHIQPVVANNSSCLQIAFSLDQSEPVNAAVYNAKGAVVRSLLDRTMGKGAYTETLPLGTLSNGVYYCAFACGSESQVMKFIIAK